MIKEDSYHAVRPVFTTQPEPGNVYEQAFGTRFKGLCGKLNDAWIFMKNSQFTKDFTPE
jgi:hypothetical protein